MKIYVYGKKWSLQKQIVLAFVLPIHEAIEVFYLRINDADMAIGAVCRRHVAQTLEQWSYCAVYLNINTRATAHDDGEGEPIGRPTDPPIYRPVYTCRSVGPRQARGGRASRMFSTNAALTRPTDYKRPALRNDYSRGS